MDRAPILMKRAYGGLMPLSPMDSAGLDSLPYEKALKVKVTRARSGPSNRLYWSVLKLVADNLPGQVKDWHLHELLKLQFGVSVEFNLKTKGRVVIPGSTSFGEMDEKAWREFLPQVLDFLTQEVLPGLGKEDVLAMAKEMIGEK